ncbi:hypothetical protein XELAEV_18038557mg [Xenopus laevis]|uniref:Uncharacterized protein n=1 Tax=Xenopus laevis TaxID=8355 RepID=A0A974C6D5_XENLA|nr:hypothetical protein XELAEV_18038557mg [Xenopus laevis]
MSPAQYRKELISTLITVAKSLIPLFWKSKVIPTLKDWALKVNEIYQFEQYKTEASNLQQQKNLTQKWFYWHQFTESPEYLTLIT